MKSDLVLVSSGNIRARILTLRGLKVLLDQDLAKLYGVETRALNQAVRRNLARFPSDFRFQLTREEHESLRSQSVIPKTGRGRHAKYLSYAFTEQGVAMLSSVLRSDRAIEVNIGIMRAFVELRGLAVAHGDLTRKVEALERKYDGRFKVVFQALRTIIAPPAVKRRRIGFRATRS
jgi:hypothetical protein